MKLFARLLALLAWTCLPALSQMENQPYKKHSAVEMTGVKAAIKLQAPVEGFLDPLNGKIDMRASEILFEPTGTVREHFHFGPGIRQLAEGELTLTDSLTGQEQTVHAGEFFYESGTRLHTVANRGSTPARVIVIELVPAGLKGAAMVPVDRRPELESAGLNLKSEICDAK